MSALDVLTAELDDRLQQADADLATHYPGERRLRQPVHTVYLPADRYDADTVTDWSVQAQQPLAEHGADAQELADAVGLRAGATAAVYERVRAKLSSEPIEDLRIDFEDGYELTWSPVPQKRGRAVEPCTTTSPRTRYWGPRHGATDSFRSVASSPEEPLICRWSWCPAAPQHSLVRWLAHAPAGRPETFTLRCAIAKQQSE